MLMFCSISGTTPLTCQYSGRHDSLRVIVLKDLYELLERIIDRCRDAGNVINHIVLKNS